MEEKEKCQRQTDVDTEGERERKPAGGGRREEAAPPLLSSFSGRREMCALLNKIPHGETRFNHPAEDSLSLSVDFTQTVLWLFLTSFPPR